MEPRRVTRFQTRPPNPRSPSSPRSGSATKLRARNDPDGPFAANRLSMKRRWRALASSADHDKSPASEKSSTTQAPTATKAARHGRAAAAGTAVKRTTSRASPVLGTSPFPDWSRPTAKECEEVNAILSRVHGDLARDHREKPVPSVLEALVQTLLSTSTSNANSSRAIQGLRHRFGEGKGCERHGGDGRGDYSYVATVDWERVHAAPVDDVFDAIKLGGLAGVKSKNIKKILEMIYTENLEKQESSNSSSGGGGGGGDEAKKPPPKEDATGAINNHNPLFSLDHLRSAPTQAVLNELMRYPGIGPKAAACVALFVLDRPVFAVDTHVYRISRWLGWVPPDDAVASTTTAVNEKTTFAHLDARIPDHLKLSLHLLLVRHGQECGRCRAITKESSEGWDNGCAIDHLVRRGNKNRRVQQQQQ